MHWDLERRRFLQICAGVLAAHFCPGSDAPLPSVAVTSSLLAKIGYAKETCVLEIELRRGGLYRYREVPETIYLELLRAESKGRYFSKNIRGKFAFERIETSQP